MIIAMIYGNAGDRHSVAWWLAVTSSEEEMTAKLTEITNKRKHPQPIPNTFETGQLISLGKSIHSFARILYIGQLPEGGLLL